MLQYLVKKNYAVFIQIYHIKELMEILLEDLSSKRMNEELLLHIVFFWSECVESSNEYMVEYLGKCKIIEKGVTRLGECIE